MKAKDFFTKPSIRRTLVGAMYAICFLMVGTLVLGSAYYTENITNNVVKKDITNAAQLASNYVESTLDQYMNIAIETGLESFLSNPDNSVEEKNDLLASKVELYGFISGTIFDAQGINIESGYSISNRDYFKQAMQGEAVVSQPFNSDYEGYDVILTICAPLRENGDSNGSIVGIVAYYIDNRFLSEITNSIDLGESSQAYMLDASGSKIAHPDYNLVASQENAIELSKTDSSYSIYAAYEQKMVNRESGFITIKEPGEKFKTNVVYMPIKNANYSLAIKVNQKDYMVSVRHATLNNIIFSLVLILINGGVFYRLAGRITNPITVAAARLATFVEGDLHSPIPSFKTKDETKDLIESMQSLQVNLTNIVEQIDFHLNAISNNDLTNEVTEEYPGDFARINQSITHILETLNSSLNSIDTDASQVNVGSEQVAIAAVSLSQGAEEQASTVTELTATVANISESVEEIVGNARTAYDCSQDAATELHSCNNEMSQMHDAMQEISEKSEQISKIIKTIEDIAFQTNILALNAAVEAARAGAAGKGFAVVADEVRNLSTKSSEAAKTTNELISQTVDSITKGQKIANKAATSLENVVEKCSVVVDSISKISEATSEQSNALSQVSIGMEQISAVIQANSQTAEETAAASEELNGQASSMKELVSAFKIKRTY